MPTICEFFGIKITVNYNDHNPPHFHAKYGDKEAIFDIGTLASSVVRCRRELQE
jgi:hypothetical protein